MYSTRRWRHARLAALPKPKPVMVRANRLPTAYPEPEVEATTEAQEAMVDSVEVANELLKKPSARAKR